MYHQKKMDLSKATTMALLSIILIIQVTEVSSQFSFRHSDCSGATYTPNSPYQTNLNTVLNELMTDTKITYGFYNLSVGNPPNQVHSLAFCRGDVPLDICRVCITDSAKTISQTCPTQMQAFGYSEYCTIYITNKPVYGTVQDSPQWYLTGSDTVTDTVGFNASVVRLMTSLMNNASVGGSEIKYASGNFSLVGDQVLYGLVQCTPDLSAKRCVDCVQGSLSLLPSCCIQPDFKASGVKIVEPSCFVQYDLTPFFGNVANLVSPPLSSPPLANNHTTSTEVQKSKKSVNPTVIAIPIVVSSVLIIAVILCILLRKKKLRKSWFKFNKEDYETLQSLQFSLGAMKNATDDFSDNFKLGQGGFGIVYKGVLPDGQEIAVKRLSRSSGQGDVQFKNEILILAKLQHRNLVTLVGFCLHAEEMLLIYEFVANRSLDFFIFDPVQRRPMLWETRYKIINGIARGILYLHEESQLRIIHRDLKAANVLLDAEFIPKIADFGMARLFNIDQTQTMTTKIVGTYGYMAPEYVLHGQVSMKSDVFSFGVLVLEILTGKKITSFLGGENPQNLLSFAWKNWIEGTSWNIVNPILTARYSTQIQRCIHIALLCVQENPTDRPNMSSVVLMLSSHTVTLDVPLQPAFFMDGDEFSQDYTSGVHLNMTPI
ncbi:hypothetical protein RND81_10G020900 [Saponaria officinalis]|uniref:Uncharacterized protein n=1 Tax=Saponaria officinalis TaxID=3572 RepID=A0AAW1HZW1_SAPOF